MKKIIYLIIVFLIIIPSCLKQIKKLINSSAELLPIQMKLFQKYNEEKINISLDSNFGEKTYSISVEYVNASFNDKGKDKKIGIANETINIIKEDYKSIDNISKVYIKFINDENFVVVNKIGEETYMFEKEGNYNWKMIEMTKDLN